MKRPFLNILTYALIICLAFTHTAWAGFIPTNDVLSQKQVEQNRGAILNLLERDDVRIELQAYGLSPAEAAQRVHALSDAEILQVKNRLDTLSTGESAIGAVVVTILVICIVLVLTDIFGLTDIFPFIKSQR